MAKIYYDRDADLNFIKDKIIAIIGYGIQGRGQALNLRDSGLNVIVSELEGTDNYKNATEDGLVPWAPKKRRKKATLYRFLLRIMCRQTFIKKQ